MAAGGPGQPQLMRLGLGDLAVGVEAERAGQVLRNRSSSSWLTHDRLLQPCRDVVEARLVRLISLCPPEPALSTAAWSFLPANRSRYQTCGLPGMNSWIARASSRLAFALAQRAEVGRVHLVVDVLLAVQVLDVAAAALDGLDQRARSRSSASRPLRSSSGMPSWQPSMLTVRIPLVTSSPIQRFSVEASAPLEGVDQQPGQEEVVGHEALGRDQSRGSSPRSWSGSRAAASARAGRPGALTRSSRSQVPGSLRKFFSPGSFGA